MSFLHRARRAAGVVGPWGRAHDSIPRRRWLPAGAAATAAVMAAAAVPAMAALAGASTGSASAPAAGQGSPVTHVLHLQAMPTGTVTFGRWHGRLTARVVMFGLTPGSSHGVRLVIPGRSWTIKFSPLTANSGGQASSVLRSHFTGDLPCVSRLVIRMGTGSDRVAVETIANSWWLRHPGHRPHQLVAVEVSPSGVRYGTPWGQATLAYDAPRQTLTVTVHATRLTPGPHAAHIHLGSCQSQGPVLYMLRDLIANSQGTIAHAVRVFTNVTKPIPAHGWYLNIHQGNSSNILNSSGQPTIWFRPLLCRNIH